MAVEARRGCGYRKVGGLYLVAGELAEVCHRLPFSLSTCPACGAGVKQTRGWQWVLGDTLSGGRCVGTALGITFCQDPEHRRRCAICSGELGRCGLLWVGAAHYSTPGAFTEEAARLGVSKRVGGVPRDLVLGATWVLLAHPAACPRLVSSDDAPLTPDVPAVQYAPGVFHAFRPRRVELILRASEDTPARRYELARRGITPVFVPDGDPDHDPGDGEGEAEL